MLEMAAIAIDDLYEVGQLELCATCRRLRGPWRCTRDPDVYLQDCGCGRAAQRTEHVGGQDWRTGRWPRFDYNLVAELCRCCGLDVLASGSRWSVWFCDHCKDWVRDLNQRVGGCVIPIGRHSIMNGVVLPATEARQPGVVDEFAAAVGSLWRLQEWTAEWATQVIERNLVAAGLELDEAIPLPRYLDYVDAHLPGKPAAVRAMLAAVGA